MLNRPDRALAVSMVALLLSHAIVRAEMFLWRYEVATSQNIFATPSGEPDNLAPRGIAMDGNGSLFVDHSGSGKVTLAGLGTYNMRWATDGPATFGFQNAVAYTWTM